MDDLQPDNPFASGAAYIDGRYMPIGEAAIPITDWGYRRSDVTYDVVGVWEGRFFRLDDHIRRFRASMRKFRFEPRESDQDIKAILNRCVALTGLKNAYVPMDCLRGRPAPGKPYHPVYARNYIAAFAIPWVWVMSPEVQERGGHLIIAETLRIPPGSVDPTAKNFHWADLTRGQFEAFDRGADFALLLDSDGNVTEGPGFNVFMVIDGVVVTPDAGVLEGITRKSVIEICADLGIPARVGKVAAGEAREADEIFLATTAGGVMPASRIDGRIMGNDRPGPILMKIRETFWAKRASGWHATLVDYAAAAAVVWPVEERSNPMSYRLGIDIGGTFTDFVAYDQEGKALQAWKNLSTPENPIEGIMTGLETFGAIDAVVGIRLGTTVATNALLEGKGATVAYVTTRGFKDVPFIGRGNRRHHYDLAWVKPKPFVQRRHAFEVDERIGPSGETIQQLDEGQVRALAREIKASGKINAIAVVLLHSYLTPDHEQRIKAIFGEEIPNIPVSISYDVLPKWKEHFRSSTTICDAFIKPVVERQLGSMRRTLDERGIGAKIVVMRSNGGEMTLDKAVEAPIQIAVSGPTGGVIAAKRTAEVLGLPNLVTLDMGGTSTDVSTVVNGKEKFTTDFEIEWGRPIQIPMIDIRTIGAGGGSIARIDAGGMLVVGPESAGANPGPACYGLGGALPTVTDANVVLGRISAQNFLGGTMSLDAKAARTGVATIADALGLSVEEAALAIVRIANNNMVGALHTVLTEQGLDPRDFVLVAFGGAGPLHISDLMTEASIPKGLVPNFPGQFSAFGFTMANARVDRYRTVQLNSRAFDAERARAAMAALVSECRSELAAQGHDRIAITRAVEMRYLGQNYELEIPIDIDAFNEAEIARLFEAFHAQHDARFGFRLDDHMEIVNFLVTGTANTGEMTFPEIGKAEGAAAPGSKRPVWFDRGWIDTSVYNRDSLRAGHAIAGPALVEEHASVTVLSPGKSLLVDRFGNLLITIN